MLAQLVSFLKKHSERATIIGLGFGLIVFVVSGIYLQKKNSKDKDVPLVTEPIKVELKVGSSKSKDNTSRAATTNSFFLRPSATELLEQLSTMENLQEDVAQSKFVSFRVLWPVFFFSVETFEGKETIILDISEDGFGAVVKGSVSSSTYPLLNEIKRGERLWVAGEITAVDPAGTGTIFLDIELLDFTADGPSSVKVEPQADLPQ
ncbi:hypothetical protein [Desulforhopalus sp. IMCC35007]|uniref:hypothetical protein n=1 Tax=Desulforhopalus sp. IMCC35007 TaxID=2569543 RepID=UPI0010ADD70B|nr:hypothetical protein [Desulforhopalus sp. IMCC35007]TKB09016.1 hypothetical protein FCL48_11100 [Desulforhopalus sp. IMCC35007]